MFIWGMPIMAYKNLLWTIMVHLATLVCNEPQPRLYIWVEEVKHRGSLGNFSKANHTTWVRAQRERSNQGRLDKATYLAIR